MPKPQPSDERQGRNAATVSFSGAVPNPAKVSSGNAKVMQSKKAKPKKAVVPATEIVKGMGTRRIATPAEPVKVEEPRGPHNQGLSIVLCEKTPENDDARDVKAEPSSSKTKKKKEPTALEVVKGMGLTADMKLSPKSDESTSPVEELSKIPTLELLANSASDLLSNDSQAKAKPTPPSILKRPKENRDVGSDNDQLTPDVYGISQPLVSPKAPRSGEVLANAFDSLNIGSNQPKQEVFSPSHEPPPPYDFAQQIVLCGSDTLREEPLPTFTAKQKRNSNDSRTSPNLSHPEGASRNSLSQQFSDSANKEPGYSPKEQSTGNADTHLSNVTGGILKKRTSTSPSRKII